MGFLINKTKWGTMKKNLAADGNFTSGANNSYWLASTEPISYAPLNNNINVDVAVVGAGIAGLTTAYLLGLEGKKVAVIEDGYVASGESGRTTAHLCNSVDDRYSEISQLHGPEAARLVAQSHTAAINLIEKICLDENIECDFERLDGHLFLHSSDERSSIEKEYAATQEAGLKTSISDVVPGMSSVKGPCLVFHGQGQFHPVKYLKGLSEAIIRNGGSIYTKTHASRIHKNTIETSSGFKVEAEFIVMATNTPVNDRVVMQTKQASYRTYVIASLIPKGSVHKALYWDTGELSSKIPKKPYHYVRLQNLNQEHDLLLIGGEDHKTGQARDMEGVKEEDRYLALETWAKEKFPMVQKIVHRWSGQIIEPVDDMAFIGRNPLDSDNHFIITGDSGNGLTHGSIGGILITDLIMGRANAWENIYDPSRKSLKTAKNYILDNLHTLSYLKEYFTPGNIEALQELHVGDGAILREGSEKVAVYKDSIGEVHAFSAVCPHLKCIVHWNNEEKSFDCPCHGSRFDCLGMVMNGPANEALQAINLNPDEESEIIEQNLRPEHPV